jgi:hypothetical protein
MDRELLERSLAQAERHIAEGEAHLVRQRALVARLELGGYDTSEAIRLLRQFEELQAFHLAHRDRLRKELGV